MKGVILQMKRNAIYILHHVKYNIDIIEQDSYWSHYFDMQTDYDALMAGFSKLSPVMAKACAYAPGIHILNQNKWEALCSFVISQNNNIKRIMGIVEKLSIEYGKKNIPKIQARTKNRIVKKTIYHFLN